MTTLSSKVLALAFASIAVASQACTFASPTEVTMVPAEQDSAATEKKADDDQAGSTTKKTSSSAGAGACKLAKVDPSKLPTACGDNNEGHCYPKNKVPGGGKTSMACANADEVCVPDLVLKAGGDELTTCNVQAVGNKPGVCLPLGTLPPGAEKDMATANLKQDVCDEGLVCQPCIDIRDGSETGLCGSVGVAAEVCGGDGATGGETTTEKKTAPTCCGGKGTCMDASGLGSTADQMAKDTCTGDLVCAPASLTAGKATKCESIMGGGICMDACFNDMLAMGGMILGQANCGEGESCIPCMFASMMAPDGAKVPGCE